MQGVRLFCWLPPASSVASSSISRRSRPRAAPDAPGMAAEALNFELISMRDFAAWPAASISPAAPLLGRVFIGQGVKMILVAAYLFATQPRPTREKPRRHFHATIRWHFGQRYRRCILAATEASY